MSIGERVKHIGAELKGHAPFTILGALTGILLMMVFKDVSKENAHVFFGIFHPAHVLLSAMVTASLFSMHKKVKSFILILVIGYVGSIGVATLSDCIIPYIGETILGVSVPKHADLHAEHEDEHVHTEDCEHDHGGEHPKIHLGFIENWYLVNPAAIIGVLIAYFLPRTKYPHAVHVLISTWASSAHILMNTQTEITIVLATGFLIVLFLAVWLPCCISDIVFPLLFVKSDLNLVDTCICSNHSHHSHPHKHEHSEKCENQESSDEQQS